MSGDHEDLFSIHCNFLRMLTRLISTVRPLTTTTTSIRLLNISAPRLGDGDQTRSKATEKAAEDLKTRKEKQWIDTPATDSGKQRI